MLPSAAELAARVKTLCPQIALSRSGTVQIFGKAAKKPILEIVYGSLPKEKQADLMAGFGLEEALNALKDDSLDIQIRNELVSAFQKPKLDPSKVYFNKDIAVPLSDLRVILNVERIRNSFLYDPTRDVRYPMSYQHICDRLEGIYGKGKKADFEGANSLDCVVRYRPHEPRLFPDPKIPEVQVFNTWSPAKWEEGYKPKKGEAPRFFRDLMQYLTTCDESRYFLEAWLRDATFSRAKPVLVLCGIPGTGKNLFVEQITAGLVGTANYRSASRGFSRTQFHSNVTSCRLFYLDEMKLSDSSRETLKSYHNAIATIEYKNDNVTDPEPLFASFVISNNDETYIHLEHSDRKFYVPDLSSTSIESILGREKTKAFAESLIKAMEDPANVVALADYLHSHYREGESDNFKKNTETFNRICIKSYPPWFKDLLTLKGNFKGARSEVQPKAVLNRRQVAFSTASETVQKFSQATGDNSIGLRMNSEGEWVFVLNPEAKELKGYEHLVGGAVL